MGFIHGFLTPQCLSTIRRKRKVWIPMGEFRIRIWTNLALALKHNFSSKYIVTEDSVTVSLRTFLIHSLIMKKLFVVESCDLPFKNIYVWIWLKHLVHHKYYFFEDIIFLINSYFFGDYLILKHIISFLVCILFYLWYTMLYTCPLALVLLLFFSGSLVIFASFCLIYYT